MINVDLSKCLGCFACSNICPNQFIIREETEGKRRTIRWSKCKEECDICVEFCPAKALTLVPYSDTTPEIVEVSFDLIPCQVCGKGFATDPLLRRIQETIPANLQKDSSGKSWVGICPFCRRELEAETASRQIVQMRKR
jgi:Pyruvate/2-oxoacid:ferredoxin oxidoreductase delta subunit